MPSRRLRRARGSPAAGPRSGVPVAPLFRDWFRAHPKAVPAYAAFKRDLASVTPDLEGYTDVKDNVVDLVITVAGTWAAATGWQP